MFIAVSLPFHLFFSVERLRANDNLERNYDNILAPAHTHTHCFACDIKKKGVENGSEAML